MKGYTVKIENGVLSIRHNGETRSGKDTDDSGDKISLATAKRFADMLFSAMENQ